MIVKGLLGEFKYETEGTRKLLNAIPDSALDFKPSEKSWTTALLASHIANIYDWYDGVFNTDVFDMAAYKYERGDISKISNIIEKFEANAAKAQRILENASDDIMMDNWKMVVKEKVIIPETPRVAIVRSFLFSHVYHHRGEMIVYLRSTGNKVPGLYGPVAEDSGS